MNPAPRRCAIYTRKSSEEGLEQSFNSLDAQRAASEAYVQSQASEGWELLPAFYDDGGFSGGSIERPGFQRLLADVAAGHIDIIVVYKIDRLTRSLADFARIVEILERADCSFVSVTQSFNTTNSMGRLMLNVLLSFAQFEREVTGERIRDKIAASKARGMWMGGNPPLGYDPPAAGSRMLRVNAEEAETVRQIFARYLALGSVHVLQRDLGEQGVVSKHWRSARGTTRGGVGFSRGALFHLLRNRIYRGKIVHKGTIHEGGHEAIVDEELFETVQRHLDANARRHASPGERRSVKAPLAGKLFDATGEPMSPTTARGKTGRTYRYYVSAPLQQGRKVEADNTVRRIAAPEIERIAGEAVRRWVPRELNPFAIIHAIHLRPDSLAIELATGRAADIARHLEAGEQVVHSTRTGCLVSVPVILPLRGGPRRIVAATARTAKPDPALIGALRRAHAALEYQRGLPVMSTSLASPNERKVLRLALLAPDIQRAILKGLQPRGFTLQALRVIDIPLSWARQREMLGFTPASEPPLGNAAS